MHVLAQYVCMAVRACVLQQFLEQCVCICVCECERGLIGLFS